MFNTTTGRWISLLALIAFMVLGSGIELSAHQESSCHEQSAQMSDCQEEQSHDACPCEGTCHMSHCHSTHGSPAAQQFVSIFGPKALDLGRHQRGELVYLNPYLGKAIQPPRA